VRVPLPALIAAAIAMSAAGAVIVTVAWDGAVYYAAQADGTVITTWDACRKCVKCVLASCVFRACEIAVYRPCDGGNLSLGPPPLRTYCLVNRTRVLNWTPDTITLHRGWLARVACLK